MRLIRGDTVFTGVDAGVDYEGNLLVNGGEGMQVHNSGEVSLRPLVQGD